VTRRRTAGGPRAVAALLAGALLACDGASPEGEGPLPAQRLRLPAPDGGAVAELAVRPVRLALRGADGELRVRQVGRGLRFEVAGRAHPLGAAVAAEAGRGSLALRVRTGAGEATLRLAWRGPRALEVELAPPEGSRPARFCDSLGLRPGEAVWGLTERAADAWAPVAGVPWNEYVPRAQGSLDRRGERVEMWVRPTVALYAPLFHSSAGYGHYVRGTLPGQYDLGARDAEVLDLCFEAPVAEPSPSFRQVFFVGGPREVADAYTALTGRPFAPPGWAFRHWRWRDELAVGEPAELDGHPINAQVAEDLRMYAELGLPSGVYLIDRPWSEGAFGFESFRWDRRRLPSPEAMLESLARRGWKLALWSAAFAVGENREEARAQGFLAPGSDLVVDLTNPAARDWWRRKHADFARRFGVAAWKLDRGEERLPSDADDVWADGRSGRAVHNDFPRLQARLYAESLAAVRRPGDFLVLFRAGYTGAQQWGAAWAGDLPGAHLGGFGPGTDKGLRAAILALLRAGFLGYPFWGSDTGGYVEFEDREVFARWLAFSAFTPIMEIGGQGAHAPWDMPTEPRFDEEMIDIYRRYVRLHHALIPLVMAWRDGPARRGVPVARALVFDHPDDPATWDLWDQYLYGEDLLVAPVWRTGAREREVYLPEGRWEDFWDAGTVHEGPATVRVAAPLDRIPVFVREGARVPGRPR